MGRLKNHFHWWAFVVLALGVVTGVFWMRRDVPMPTMPSPNGYDDIQRAADLMVDGANASSYQDLSEDDLRAVVASNAISLNILRMGLSRECRVPMVEPSPYDTNIIFRGRKQRELALVVGAEGRLALLDGRTNDAVRSHVDVIRLGHASARGGMLLDALVGIAIESLGLAGLERITNGLSHTELRQIIKDLEQLEERRQSAAEVVRVERVWGRRAYSLLDRIQAMIATLSWHPSARFEAGYSKKLEELRARHGKLLMRLAERAFELENGRAPTNANELVPKYLQRLPTNAVTNVKSWNRE